MSEGGRLFDNAGVIHISELKPTLSYLSKIIGLSDIEDRLLGSVGKKQYSGDIDIAMDVVGSEDMTLLHNKLQAIFGSQGVKRKGQMISVSAPIQNFNPEYDERYPRTGFVQTDFIFGDVPWLKLYDFSPSEEESKLKGLHRNIAISTLAAFTERDASEEKDEYGRPVRLVRWKWSPRDGFVKVMRTSRINDKTGKTIKKQDEVLLGEPIKDADGIAKILFRGHAGAEALNSAESIVNVVKKAFPEDTQEEIFQEMAKNFKERHARGMKGGNFEYPPEIAKYMHEDPGSNN